MFKKDKEKPYLFLLGCHFGIPTLRVVICCVTGVRLRDFPPLNALILFLCNVITASPLVFICRTTYALFARFMAKQQRLFIFYATSILYPVNQTAMDALFPNGFSVSDRLSLPLWVVTDCVVIWFLCVFIAFIVSFPFRKKEDALQKTNGMFVKMTPFVFWAGLCFFWIFSVVSLYLGLTCL
jgi:hypothetical protein